MPLVHRAARRAKRDIGRLLRFDLPEDQFYTLSPHVLVALARALDLQRQDAAAGRNRLDGHGYYEFGMFRGFSFWYAEQLTRHCGGEGLQLYGFDSFAGLPPDLLATEAALYSPGAWACSYAQVLSNLRHWGIDESRISLFKGFFSDEMFRELGARVNFPPVSICLIDVDLYASCVPVLEFIRHYLVPGSILLFDDYNHFGPHDEVGERRALIEFEARHPSFRKQHLFDYGPEGVAFRVESP